MNSEELKNAIEVMAAFLDGKEIEAKNKNRDDDSWTPVKVPVWNWGICDYRIKPKKWSGKIMVHKSGATLDYQSAKSNLSSFKRNGWRVVEAKEI